MTKLDVSRRKELLTQAFQWREILGTPDVSAHDQKAFEAWIAADPTHADIYDYAETFFQAMGTVSNEDLRSDVTGRSAHETRIDIRDKITGLLGRVGRKPIGITAIGASMAAACIALALLASPNKLEIEPAAITMAAYESPVGKTNTIDLDDGSVVTLGAASEISVGYGPDERLAVVTSGSAFFEVSSDPDRPFKVSAGDMTVTVTGTEFDVIRRNRLVRVAVAEGSVDVSYPFVINDQATSMVSRKSLQAGERVLASIDAGLGAVESIPDSAIGAWRENTFYYDSAPLFELIDDANRHFENGVQFDGPEAVLTEFKVHGSYNAGDIDEMMKILAEVYPLDVTRSDQGAIIIRPREDQED